MHAANLCQFELKQTVVTKLKIILYSPQADVKSNFSVWLWIAWRSQQKSSAFKYLKQLTFILKIQVLFFGSFLVFQLYFTINLEDHWKLISANPQLFVESYKIKQFFVLFVRVLLTFCESYLVNIWNLDISHSINRYW